MDRYYIFDITQLNMKSGNVLTFLELPGFYYSHFKISNYDIGKINETIGDKILPEQIRYMPEKTFFIFIVDPKENKKPLAEIIYEVNNCLSEHDFYFQSRTVWFFDISPESINRHTESVFSFDSESGGNPELNSEKALHFFNENKNIRNLNYSLSVFQDSGVVRLPGPAALNFRFPLELFSLIQLFCLFEMPIKLNTGNYYLMKIDSEMDGILSVVKSLCLRLDKKLKESLERLLKTEIHYTVSEIEKNPFSASVHHKTWVDINKRWQQLGNAFSCDNKGSLTSFVDELGKIHADFLKWQENIFNGENYLELKDNDKINTPSGILKEKRELLEAIRADEEAIYFIPLKTDDYLTEACNNMMSHEEELQFLYSRCPNAWLMWGSVIFFTVVYLFGFEYLAGLFPDIWWYASVILILILSGWLAFFFLKRKVEKQIKDFIKDRRNELAGFSNRMKNILEQEFHNQQTIQELRVLNGHLSTLENVLKDFENKKATLEKKMEKLKFIHEIIPEHIPKVEVEHITEEIDAWSDIRYKFNSEMKKISDHRMTILNDNTKDEDYSHTDRINVIRKINIKQGYPR